jgi:hypothetical protein
MRIRIMFEQPQTRPTPPPFIGNEIEGTVSFDVATATATGFFGSFTELPEDPTSEAVRHTSTPFTVILTPTDMQQVAAIVLGRAAEQGVGGMFSGSIVRID